LIKFPSVSRSAANPAQLGERPVAGRLSGLSPREAERGGRALWLSGDGHRAALFHLGALTRLNELGLLGGLARIGASSGASIAAAVLATRVRWPLDGSCPDWEARVAEPLREIASRAFEPARRGPRRPFPGAAGEAALEERFARELLAEAGERARRGPRFVFGAPGLALGGIAAEREGDLEWDIADVAAGGYEDGVLAETIRPRAGLGGFGEGTRAVLENHGYLLAESAAAALGVETGAGAARAPHPDWMDPERVRTALAGTARRPRLLRLRRREGSAERRERAG